MKLKKINILLAATFAGMVTLVGVGCTKDDGPIPSRVSIENVPTISTTIDATTATISMASLGTFAGKFAVSQYFPGTTPPTKIDIVARKGFITGTVVTMTNANVKLFKAGAVTTYPTTFTVTAADIAAMFGTAVALNDVYDFGVDIYVGDKKYEAFPAASTGTGAGVAQSQLFSELARYIAKP
jgi:hypothetical protein